MRTTRWAKTLVVAVSVEADDPSVVGTIGSYRALDGLWRLQELCGRYGVRPTYALTYSAAREPRVAEFAGAFAAEAEFGAHLHPEEVPPVAEGERDNHTLRASQVEPPRLRAKLRNLVECVERAVGRRPTSYRSGFFDLTPAQVAMLAELGIEADSSLGPLEKVGATHPFLHAPFVPYVVSAEDVCRPLRPGAGDGVLVEVPMTTVFRKPFPRALHRAYFRLPGRARGALRALGLAELVSFRPAMASGDDLLAVCRRTERLGIPAVMTIHSNELWPGTSLTVPTEAARAAYFDRLDCVFAAARERGWRSLTLTEVARTAREAGGERGGTRA